MTDHPALFKGDMILAIQDGSKTQTRRVISPQPDTSRWKPEYINKPKEWRLMVRLGPVHHGFDPKLWCLHDTDSPAGAVPYTARLSPYGVPGDLLWVRETWQGFNKISGSIITNGIPKVNYGGGFWVAYKADNIADKNKCTWRPSIHMPKWACRLWLKVKSVRVERVQEITIASIKAEGVRIGGLKHRPRTPIKTRDEKYKAQWIALWDSINEKPRPRYTKKEITHYESYPWQDIRETRKHRGKPWHVIGNPFVFATEFERTEHD